MKSSLTYITNKYEHATTNVILGRVMSQEYTYENNIIFIKLILINHVMTYFIIQTDLNESPEGYLKRNTSNETSSDIYIIRSPSD